MKSLCKLLNSRDSTLDAYVIGNAARPLLSHGPKGSKVSRRSYLYVEAIRKFDKECKEMDLTEAYKRARPSFIGRLERTFIVLKDNPGEEIEIVTGANREPVGEKMDM